MNLPTRITVSRIILIPLIVLFFYVDFHGHYYCATILYALCAITDILDGSLARKKNMITDLGKFLDPVADKVLAITAMVILLDRQLMIAPYGAIMTAVIICREIIVGMFRAVAAGKGIVLAADKIGKIKTIFTNIALPMMIFGGCRYEFYENAKLETAGTIIGYIGFGFFVIAFIFTVISGVNYIVSNKGVLSSTEKK